MKKETIYHIFSHMPTLESERLILRQMIPSDSEDMFDYARKREVSQYLTWSPHPSERYTETYLQYLSEHYAVGDFYDWGLVLKEKNRLIGTCGFTRFDFANDSAEVGYVLNSDCWGRGLAPEALARVMTFGFEKLRLHRIEARYMEGNDSSRRVMEKVGMQFEGWRRESLLVRGLYRTVGTCCVLAGEFSGIRSGWPEHWYQ